jgi:hypothetical protein
MDEQRHAKLYRTFIARLHATVHTHPGLTSEAFT